jgi:Family of unknown function (DUF6352)
MSRDFWLTSGFHLTTPTPRGRSVTGALLRAWLERPEIAPIDESCEVERALHAALMLQPSRTVAPDEVAQIADPDTRANYALWLAFRDRLLAAPSIEAAYLDLTEQPIPRMPPMFLDQLAQIILRGLLADETEPAVLRAAELLFRTQRVSLQDGAIVVADEETVERLARADERPLEALLGAVRPSAELDVLSDGTATRYWESSDHFDFALELTYGRPGVAALARVLERWTLHLRGIEVRIEPVPAIRDERWTWHIGLDAAASELMNQLYAGGVLEEEDARRVLALFRLEFLRHEDVLPRVAGRPVWLGIAATAEGLLRIKPQNLVHNLPLARAA